MPSLENRVAKLEAEMLKVNLSELSDEELRAHIATLPFKSSEGYGAIITLILRHGSALPVIYNDPVHQNIGDPTDW